MGGFVLVQVIVDLTVGVSMGMMVGLVLDGPVQAPDKIGEAEADEKPGGGVAAPGLGNLELVHGDAQGQAQKTEHNGTQDMTQARKEGDQQCLFQWPLTGFGHGDKRKIMVRTQKGVHESQGDCRPRYYPYFVVDH